MKHIKQILIMTLGSLMVSLGVYFFELPNGFVTGGVASWGLILSGLTPISAPTWILLFNGCLLLLGFLILGKKTGIKTVYCTLLYSGATYLLEFIYPVSAPFSTEPVLELIWSILLVAGGCALVFHCGGTTGGTDIVAMILKKFTDLNIGIVIFLADLLAATSAFYFFGSQIGLLSLLGLFARAFLVDGVIESFNASKYCVIITQKGEEITAFIFEKLDRGVTVHGAIGAYTGKEKTMLHVVCSRGEARKLRIAIKSIDPDAFIIITTSNEILGYGFRPL